MVDNEKKTVASADVAAVAFGKRKVVSERATEEKSKKYSPLAEHFKNQNYKTELNAFVVGSSQDTAI